MERGYDYIVIGSGSAGAVIAARLTEDPAVSVLLLEAGPRDRHPLQLMPLAFARVAAGRIGTWQYESEPEPGLCGRTLPIPRGRTLGGTSSINAMIAIRGNRLDYDDWAAQGLDGWSYAEVLPYFKRLERDWRGAGQYHGGQGPVAITRMHGPEMVWEPLVQAAAAAGIPFCDDPNGAMQDGISHMESTTDGGRRASSARAYLHPAMGRPNLTIETGVLARRIVVEAGRARSVEYLQRGQVRRARATGEIVLCGGAYNSPQLLLLSGIGPSDEIRAAGIEVVHDLPGVGRNLAEHPNIINEYILRGDGGLTPHLRFDRAVVAAARWFGGGKGVFAYTGTSANVFARSLPGLDRPDIQMMTMPVSGGAGVWLPLLQRKPPSRISVRTGFLHPASRGWVKLRSNDPYDPPRIFNNMFGEPGDLEAMVRALKLSRAIHRQAPLSDLIREEAMPGVDVNDDGQLRGHIRRNAGHRSHPVGTCRMGTGEDAVVDAQLKVRGIEGLRIADASVMPALPSGNTNLPTIMIGEKAADMLLGRCLPPERLAR